MAHNAHQAQPSKSKVTFHGPRGPLSLLRPEGGGAGRLFARSGVVQNPPILGNTDERIPAAHEGSVHVSSANQIEESNRRRSALAGLQLS